MIGRGADTRSALTRSRRRAWRHARQTSTRTRTSTRTCTRTSAGRGTSRVRAWMRSAAPAAVNAAHAGPQKVPRPCCWHQLGQRTPARRVQHSATGNHVAPRILLEPARWRHRRVLRQQADGVNICVHPCPCPEQLSLAQLWPGLGLRATKAAGHTLVPAGHVLGSRQLRTGLL